MSKTIVENILLLVGGVGMIALLTYKVKNELIPYLQGKEVD
jgi:hypothetical protein